MTVSTSAEQVAGGKKTDAATTTRTPEELAASPLPTPASSADTSDDDHPSNLIPGLDVVEDGSIPGVIPPTHTGVYPARVRALVDKLGEAEISARTMRNNGWLGLKTASEVADLIAEGEACGALKTRRTMPDGGGTPTVWVAAA